MKCCDLCESDAIEIKYLEEKFIYGSGEDEVVLSAQVPVYVCRACDEMYTGGEAEILRHEAICEHLGRLKPRDIRKIREDFGFSQEKFANVSGFGVASIKRWELGNQIQGESANNLLLLLRIPGNLKLVEAANRKETFRPLFRTRIPDSAIQHSKDFRLRPESRMELAA